MLSKTSRVISSKARNLRGALVKRDSSGKLKFPSSQPTLIPRRPCAGSLTILTSAPTGVELRFEMTR